ncbi:hypothetical protein JCGZ_05458 [Jatropha curcas]|uniref:SAUR family protein n=1 Tax=Jatropha curcas TaxID=180498 RepID=A0A067L688_JATCU|nr:auxin-induced protein 15A [Jatropha curcas]KDP43991.1 hypothetical protein JCGZ_05458 [Jatropha curcas]
MATFRASNTEKRNGIMGLKIAAKKLQKRLSLGKRGYDIDECEEVSVPKDVKEGHFAVIAMDINEEPKRFVLPLSYLSHPTFLRLLEQAAEEYGFGHEGALAIPCRPCELAKILADDSNWVL